MTLPSPALTWLQGSGEQVIDGSATITDIDSAALDTGILVAEFISGGNANDRLTILTDSNAPGKIDVQGTDARYGGIIIGSITGPGTISSSLVVRLNTSATVAATQELMRRLAFENVASPVITGPRTVRVYVTDGSGGTSLPVTKIITLQSVNVVPAVTLPTGSAAWTEHATASLIDSAATVIDSDAGTLNTGILTVSMSNAVVGDRISIRSTGVGSGQVSLSGSTVLVSGIAIGTFMGGTNTTALSVTFNAQSTPAAAQAILRLVQFSHIGQFTSVETRAVRVTVTDGFDISPIATTTLTLTPVDDPPTTSAITLVTVADISTPATLPGTDPEAGTLTWEIVTAPAFGTLTLTNANTGAVTYVSATGQTTDTSFTFRVRDGLTWSAPATATVKLSTPLANARPLVVSSPPREGVIGATFTYLMTIDVSALPPGADLRFQILNPPTGATVNVTRTTATTATLTWDQTGSADIHRQIGVLVSDATTGTASYQPIQVLWLAVAPAGPG